MNRLRILLALTITWFFLLYNIERLSDPINIAGFVYGFTFLSALAVIAVPALHQQPLSLVLGLLLPVYFVAKWYLGYQIVGSGLPLTVTEIAAIVVTLMLARQIMERFVHLQQAVARVTLAHLKEAASFDDGQGLIYREIRRARRRQRSLALLAIKPTVESASYSLDRFFEEAQGEIIKQYVNAKVANLLLSELEDYDIVTRRNNHFIVVLSEADPDELAETVQRLQNEARRRLGIEFNVGQARFPEDAVTFSQLLNDAERGMRQLAEEPAPAPDSEAASADAAAERAVSP